MNEQVRPSKEGRKEGRKVVENKNIPCILLWMILRVRKKRGPTLVG